MHINWPTKVKMPVYDDAEMIRALRCRIQAATDDDLLASLLHFAEGRVALNVYRRFEELLGVLEREKTHAVKLDDDDDTPLCYEYRQANFALLQDLSGVIAQTESVKGTLGGVWHSLREATTGSLNERYKPGADPAASGLDAIGPLIDDLLMMREELAAILALHCERTQDLALREAEFRTFAATTDSISASQLDGMAPLEFELAIASFVQRDGYTVVQRNGGARDLGADVIATTPDGRRIVFQCKHRRPGGRPLGSPVIQTLNGTARPVHQADIVIAVTNSSFTTPAHELAEEQDIHLLWGPRLHNWATWGIPLLSVLAIEARKADAAA